MKIFFSVCGRFWFWDIDQFILECNCHPQGSANNTCNNQTGECFCKNEYVTGDKCDECVEGTFNCLSPKGKWDVGPNHEQVNCDYTGDIHCKFIHCNEAMKNSNSLQWKQWNCKRRKLLILGEKIAPSLGISLHYCLKNFQFETDKKWM